MVRTVNGLVEEYAVSAAVGSRLIVQIFINDPVACLSPAGLKREQSAVAAGIAATVTVI
jgi:hypothetical protein